jgi:glucosamine--fructose-6-phosphate aminotransferase (isomerizing)
MCGIVGYIGPQDATPIILSGLKRLEYRGYDSAGLAVLQNSHIEVRRDVGKLGRLARAWLNSRSAATLASGIHVGLRMASLVSVMPTRTWV